MKMMKKITAVLLALLFCLCAVGCSDKDPNAPEGMKSATIWGEPFTLYVPEGWSDNTASGVSGAYYSAVDGLSVSARYVPANGMSVEDYLNTCIASLSAQYAEQEFVLTEDKAEAILGKKDARRISYEFKQGELTINCSQITAEHNGDLVSLYRYCPKSELEKRAEALEQIRSAFVLGERTAAPAEVITKDTPEGMKLASRENIEYRLFVPKEWVCDPESGANDAYYPDPQGGNPHISVTSFVPDSSMSVSDYFARCEEQYRRELPEYTLVGGPEERQVSGRAAYSYTYTVRVQGTDIKIMQTILAYDSSFYTITYTARTEAFEGRLEDVYKILDNFKFR